MFMDFAAALARYAEALKAACALPPGVEAGPEEQLKKPIRELLEAAGEALGVHEVSTYPEARARSLGRPDIGVTSGGLLIGYVELKRPGRGANPKKFKGHDKNQWSKFENLPNLVYTDGVEFAHFRSGERNGRVVRLSGDPTTDGVEALEEKDASRLFELLRDFLYWEPVVPKRPKALAELLAPVCRLLRDEVEDALQDTNSALKHLADDWRRYFFPDASNREFADAYAQTLTYALLLARFSGEEDLSIERASERIRSGHHVLSAALRVLGDPVAREQVKTPMTILERILEAVDPKIFQFQSGLFDPEGARDPWLYFYEDFLAAYDPRMRKNRGVYYTPWQVVQAQVNLVAQLLDERFDAPDAFVDDAVVTLDPACGTGTYILAAVRHGLDAAAARRGEGARAGAATRAAANVHAFEVLVGPYAVAHLRLTQQVLANGGRLPVDGAHVYLADTLESPHEKPPEHLPYAYQVLSEEHRRAQKVKREVPILVCMGNPPYDREQAAQDQTLKIEDRKGGWIRHGKGQKIRALLDDFIEPLAKTGDGLHAKNLYNDYVYFWRWALWKVCEQEPDHGIVSFITASSYLRGPAFKGMRKMMREAFDELWILDLGGDNLGARKSANVFAIRTPVCIAIGVRHRAEDERRQASGTPARVRYLLIEGEEAEKLEFLDRVESYETLDWMQCPDEWTAAFKPMPPEPYASWPQVTDLFPWQESGVQFKRSWPIGETVEVLEKRWEVLTSREWASYLTEKATARTVDRSGSSFFRSDLELRPLRSLNPGEGMVPAVRYAYRSFDLHWCLPDTRLCDRHRPTLQKSHSRNQIYLISFLTEVLGEGPSVIATAAIPDLHYFRGSFGGKHIVPLLRDHEGNDANVTLGVLKVLGAIYQRGAQAEDLFAYAYCVLSAPDYVARFWKPLAIPGPRLPITKRAQLFLEVSALGRELLWIHTYGERFVPAGVRPGPRGLPRGSARLARATPQEPVNYPESWSYDSDERVLRIGEGSESGRVRDVPPEVMEFSISGFLPVKSWLDYRMKKGAGRKSSPLDDIRPETWTFDDELIDLLWVLEATLERYQQANNLLERILEGETFTADAFPRPTAEEKKGPAGKIAKLKPTPLFDDQ